MTITILPVSILLFCFFFFFFFFLILITLDLAFRLTVSFLIDSLTSIPLVLYFFNYTFSSAMALIPFDLVHSSVHYRNQAKKKKKKKKKKKQRKNNYFLSHCGPIILFLDFYSKDAWLISRLLPVTCSLIPCFIFCYVPMLLGLIKQVDKAIVLLVIC
ncbi:uncharacterized protein EURHEDRAFT_274726 [Aspergillus ruber CBS 135680]|uniref:Uncharacterized protein n=1 Tax=Aspergillus ruber (strain CBS 135680) TaxID=1388766 RepID=A0A017SMQ2_ASPRC|nr:uncharacterized protein EURHEDRAFT_274726 [Aspergillus ruber CBS 135680]EYE98242.1 hypothetical protein EURHEDRAFT_274726 [Aspergillus ruber CBS 135680]